MTVDKVTFVTTRQHLRRQEEPYFRLTPSQLSELLSEYEQVGLGRGAGRVFEKIRGYKHGDASVITCQEVFPLPPCHLMALVVHSSSVMRGLCQTNPPHVGDVACCRYEI